MHLILYNKKFHAKDISVLSALQMVNESHVIYHEIVKANTVCGGAIQLRQGGCEFEDSLSYTVSPYLNKPNKTDPPFSD